MRATVNDEVRRLARTLWNFHTAPAQQIPDRSDLILALGSHDLRVPQFAAELWQSGYAPLLVMSGDRGRRTNGSGRGRRWERPESHMFAEAARGVCDIPGAALLLESRATNTGENFDFSRELLSERGVEAGRAIVTAKPYMAQRALATACIRWPQASWCFAAPGLTFGSYPDKRCSESELVHFLVGDLQRLAAYARKGWNAPVAVPDHVWNACARLEQLGFTEHAIASAEEVTPRAGSAP